MSMKVKELRRIVSLEPSVTAILAALGQMERVTAVSAYCHQLVEVGDRPRLPSTWSLKVEEILPLAPDLVIVSVPYAAESITALLKAKLNVLCLYPQTLADVYAHIAWLGGLTGTAVRAEAVITEMQTTLAGLAQRGNAQRTRVYVEMWPKPTMCSVEWVAELVELAGGNFVPRPAGRTITAEEVAAADPEQIIVAWAGIAEPDLEQVRTRPGWEGVTAVRHNRITALPEIYLNAPGPNLAQAGLWLAEAIWANT